MATYPPERSEPRKRSLEGCALAVVEACVEAMRDLYTFSFASYNL